MAAEKSEISFWAKLLSQGEAPPPERDVPRRTRNRVAMLKRLTSE